MSSYHGKTPMQEARDAAQMLGCLALTALSGLMVLVWLALR